MTFGNSGPIDEGSTGTVSFTDQLDPSSADTTAGFTYGYDFNNDGDFTDPGDIAGSSVASASIPARYLADGPATVTVQGRIADPNGAFRDYTTPV